MIYAIATVYAIGLGYMLIEHMRKKKTTSQSE